MGFCFVVLRPTSGVGGRKTLTVMPRRRRIDLRRSLRSARHLVWLSHPRLTPETLQRLTLGRGDYPATLTLLCADAPDASVTPVTALVGYQLRVFSARPLSILIGRCAAILTRVLPLANQGFRCWSELTTLWDSPTMSKPRRLPFDKGAETQESAEGVDPNCLGDVLIDFNTSLATLLLHSESNYARIISERGPSTLRSGRLVQSWRTTKPPALVSPFCGNLLVYLRSLTTSRRSSFCVRAPLVEQEARAVPHRTPRLFSESTAAWAYSVRSRFC